jgi:hypothetical protein
MFNLEDTKTIMNIINQRDTDKMLFPVCVKIDQNYYYIPTLDQLDIVGSNIKIVFGTSINVFIKKKFPKNLLLLFDNVKMFNYFDEEKQVATEYFYFESGYVEAAGSDPINVAEEINGWCDILIPYVKDILEKNRKEKIRRMMEEQS